jgi:hypothetical protein
MSQTELSACYNVNSRIERASTSNTTENYLVGFGGEPLEFGRCREWNCSARLAATLLVSDRLGDRSLFVLVSTNNSPGS